MHKATLTSKGQITIPKEVREFLDVSAGDTLDFNFVFSFKENDIPKVEIKKADDRIKCPVCDGKGMFKKYGLRCFVCDYSGRFNREQWLAPLFLAGRRYGVDISMINEGNNLVPTLKLRSKIYTEELLIQVQDQLQMILIEDHAPRSISDPSKYMIPSDYELNNLLELLHSEEAKSVVKGWFRGDRTI